MSIEILRERFRTKIAFQLDLELWFAGPAYRKHDSILSVYDNEELSSFHFRTDLGTDGITILGAGRKG
jgi:hypothetical protein